MLLRSWYSRWAYAALAGAGSWVTGACCLPAAASRRMSSVVSLLPSGRQPGGAKK
jgi:hypothetical protein